MPAKEAITANGGNYRQKGVVTGEGSGEEAGERTGKPGGENEARQVVFSLRNQSA